jgi:hypothetical protein
MLFLVFIYSVGLQIKDLRYRTRIDSKTSTLSQNICFAAFFGKKNQEHHQKMACRSKEAEKNTVASFTTLMWRRHRFAPKPSFLRRRRLDVC